MDLIELVRLEALELSGALLHNLRTKGGMGHDGWKKKPFRSSEKRFQKINKANEAKRSSIGVICER